MRVFVDPRRCRKCGICSDGVPAVFEIRGEHSVVIADPVPPEFEDEVLEALDTCPGEAISLS